MWYLENIAYKLDRFVITSFVPFCFYRIGQFSTTSQNQFLQDMRSMPLISTSLVSPAAPAAQRSFTKFSIVYLPLTVMSRKEKLSFDTSKVSAAKFSILYYLSLVISQKEKLAFDLSKVSAAKFSILYYLSLVISQKEKLAFGLNCKTFFSCFISQFLILFSLLFSEHKFIS